jgi:predicted transcriptional regulator
MLLLNHILCFQIARKKEVFRQDINDFLQKDKELKETKKHEEEIQRKLIEIYGRSKQKIEKMRKDKNQEVIILLIAVCNVMIWFVTSTIKNYIFC